MRFSKQIIRQAVAEVESGVSRQEVCKKYGMSYGTLGEWLLKYGSQEYQENKRSQFSNSQKRDIIRRLQSGKITIAEASLAYKVDRRTLQKWLRLAQQDNISPPDTKVVQSPHNEQEQLKKDLEEARLKILSLETLIDVAEDELKIKIRKKPGAKQ
jgi:transposase